MSRVRMDEENMLDAADQYKGISNEMVGAADTAQGSFIGMKAAGFFNKGFSDVQGQIGSLGSSINNLSNIVNESTTTTIEIDEQGVKEFQGVEVPQDFVANNSMRINEFNNSLLEKIDGKHVDSNAAEEKVETDDESVINKIQTFDDVTTEATQEQTYDDNVSIKEQQELVNINNPEGTEEQKIDESTVISEEERMANINNGEGLQEQELNDNSVIENVDLGTVENQNIVEKQELDVDLDDIEDAAINDMNPSVIIESGKE